MLIFHPQTQSEVSPCLDMHPKFDTAACCREA